MNDVGHVRVLRLCCGAVCGDVEVSGDLEKKKINKKPLGVMKLFILTESAFHTDQLFRCLFIFLMN